MNTSMILSTMSENADHAPLKSGRHIAKVKRHTSIGKCTKRAFELLVIECNENGNPLITI